VSWGDTFSRSIGGRLSTLSHGQGGKKYSLPSARIFSPGEENILAGGERIFSPPGDILGGRKYHGTPADIEEPVRGITVVGSDLFVVLGTSKVYVYNSTSFTSNNNIMITGSQQLHEIVSCSHNNCLYVSDWEQKTIYRYDFSNNVTTLLESGQ